MLYIYEYHGYQRVLDASFVWHHLVRTSYNDGHQYNKGQPLFPYSSTLFEY